MQYAGHCNHCGALQGHALLLLFPPPLPTDDDGVHARARMQLHLSTLQHYREACSVQGIATTASRCSHLP